MNVSIASESFRNTMETRLAIAYNLAMTIYRRTFYRFRRAVTFGNATIQIIMVTRQWSNNQPTWVDIIYSFRRFIRPNCSLASEAVTRLLLVPTQQLAIILQYTVITAAETYSPPRPSNLWIIGAVIGVIVAIVIIVWCVLFCYCKLRQLPPNTIDRCAIPEIDDKEPVDHQQTDIEQCCQSSNISRSEKAVCDSKKTKRSQKSKSVSSKLQVSVPDLEELSIQTLRSSCVENKDLERIPHRQKRQRRSKSVKPQKQENELDKIDTSPEQTATESESTVSEPLKLVPVGHTPVHVSLSSVPGNSFTESSWNSYTTSDLANTIIHDLAQYYQHLDDTNNIDDVSTSGHESALEFSDIRKVGQVQLLPGEICNSVRWVENSSTAGHHQQALNCTSRDQPQLETIAPDDYTRIYITTRTLNQ